MFRNPYNSRKPGTSFVGYSQFRETVIRNNWSYRIVGGPKIGKTSLLLQLEKEIPTLSKEPPYLRSGYIDLSKTIEEKGPFRRFYEEVVRGAQGVPAWEKTNSDEYSNFIDCLKRAKPTLDQSWGKDWCYILLLDNLDLLEPVDSLFPQNLEDLFTTSSFCDSFRVIATSEKSELEGYSTLLRTQPLRILKKKEALKLIESGFDQKYISLEASSLLLDLTGRHPYVMQGVLEILRETLEDGKTVTETKIRKAADAFVQEDSVFEQWFDRLFLRGNENSQCYELLLEKQTLDPLEIDSSEFSISSMYTALDKFQYYGLVEEIEEGIFQLRGSLFRDWYQEQASKETHKPLDPLENYTNFAAQYLDRIPLPNDQSERSLDDERLFHPVKFSNLPWEEIGKLLREQLPSLLENLIFTLPEQENERDTWIESWLFDLKKLPENKEEIRYHSIFFKRELIEKLKEVETFKQNPLFDLPCSLPKECFEAIIDIVSFYNDKIAPLAKQAKSSILPTLEVTAFPYSEKAEESLPVTLRQIAIANFQCIDRMQLLSLPTNAPWIFVTGENGDGKTSFLQAIAIALCGTSYDELFDNDTEIDLELQKEKQKERVREFRYFSRKNQGQKPRGIYSEKQKLKDIFPGENTSPEFPYVVGYGPSRTHADKNLPKNEREDPVYNLLKKKGNLKKFEEWFKDQEHERNKKGISEEEREIIKNQREQFKQLMIELLPGIDDIDQDGKNVLYTEKGREVCWDHLSSGHRTILAMIGDMVVRLFATQPEVIDPKELKGIVLIDEIETHLHPKWEFEFPQLLTKHFPKIQFIATTHSPVPLLGAPSGSVILKASRNKERGTEIERINVDIENFTTNLVLTSPIFDMKHIISAQNRDLAKLCTEDNYREVEERLKLREDLKKLGLNAELIPDDFLD